MKVQKLVEIIGSDFYTGVPDSQLKALCNNLMATWGIDPKHHIIAANEGNCVALAAGYHLATGKVPVVYMQNSGEGNVINPVASLLNDKVYAIPMVFMFGVSSWALTAILVSAVKSGEMIRLFSSAFLLALAAALIVIAVLKGRKAQS